MHRPIIAILCASLSTACSSLDTRDFASEKPTFDPIVYFTGKTSSSGVCENRGGNPVEQVFTATSGKMNGEFLYMEQELRFVSPKETKTSHRTWKMRKTGPHSYEATANDMIGTATGEAFGNTFHWTFPLAFSPGNPLLNIRMSQWMYLQPDGRTMLNHTTITKAGIAVSQVTEQFSKK